MSEGWTRSEAVAVLISYVDGEWGEQRHLPRTPSWP
jgi:hypothetical protein